MAKELKTKYDYYARVLRVIDGDTLLLDVDLGFHTHCEVRVRIAGIDAPPKGTIEGDAATATLSAFLFVANDVKQNGYPLVYVQSFKTGDSQDKYGRWVANVKLLEPVTILEGTPQHSDVALYLLAMGHAKPYGA